MRAKEPTKSQPPQALSSQSRRFAWLVITAVFALCFFRLARLVRDGAVNVLFGDQWDFLAPLFRDESPAAMFMQQHGPHRQGLGGALQWLIYRLSDWDVRGEVWCGVAFLAAAALAALSLVARIRGRVQWWDAAVIIIILNPLHWETLFLAPNIAHSVIPGFLALLLSRVWLMRGTAPRLASVATIGVLCTFTGFGICATVASVIVAAAATSAKNDTRAVAAGTIALLGAGIAFFLVGYQWSPAVPGWHFPVTPGWDYARFGAFMCATLVGLREKTILATVVGGGLFALMVGVWAVSLWQIWNRGAQSRTTSAAILTGTSLVYIALTAVGRLPVSVEAAFMWRYITLTMVGMVGVFIFMEPWMSAARAPTRWIAVGAATLFSFVVWFNFAPEQRVSVIAAAKRKWVSAYLDTHDLPRANAQSEFWVYPPQPNAAHIAERLRWLEEKKLSFFSDR